MEATPWYACVDLPPIRTSADSSTIFSALLTSLWLPYENSAESPIDLETICSPLFKLSERTRHQLSVCMSAQYSLFMSSFSSKPLRLHFHMIALITRKLLIYYGKKTRKLVQLINKTEKYQRSYVISRANLTSDVGVGPGALAPADLSLFSSSKNMWCI